MRKILLSAVFVIAIIIPLITEAAVSSNPYVTRVQLIKILKKERPESNILGANIFGVKKKLLRPRDPLTLAEAAVFITNAFKLEKVKNPNLRPSHSEAKQLMPSQGWATLEWFESSLIALESENAIPTSIFTIMEKLTHKEVLEIIDRLKNNITDRPSMAFQSLVHPRYMGPQWSDFWRVGVPLANAKLLRLLKEPAYYQIFDVSADEQKDNSYCQRYAAETVTVVENKVAQPRLGINEVASLRLGLFEVTFTGKSTDYCDEGKAKPYELRIPVSASDRIKIVRAKLEKLPYEWGSSGPFYEQTRVDTQGTLETTILENGETLFVYRTPWQPIFNDLRGTPFFMAAKTLSNGKEWMKFYEGPAHNRDFYGYGTLSYEKCISDPVASNRSPMLFCIKKEGGHLVVASRLELGDRLTLWIDEHFKR